MYSLCTVYVHFFLVYNIKNLFIGFLYTYLYIYIYISYIYACVRKGAMKGGLSGRLFMVGGREKHYKPPAIQLTLYENR